MIKICLAILMVACFSQYTFASSTLRAGAAKRLITPKESVYLAGLANNRRSTGVHDNLYARCLILDDGRTRVGFVSLDLIGLTSHSIRKLRERANAAGLDTEGIIFTCTHQHSGPDTIGLWGPDELTSGVNPNYLDFLYHQIIEAVQEAGANLHAAEIRLGKTGLTQADRVSHNVREPDLIDRELGVIKIDNLEGGTIATVVNFTAHPETMWSDNLSLTADYPGVVYRECDTQLGGVTLFINGALGGMVTVDNVDENGEDLHTFAEVERIGGMVAQAAIKAAKNAQKQENPTIRHQQRTLEVPLENANFQALMELGVLPKALLRDGKIQTEVHIIEIGKAQIATYPGEATPKLGLRVKSKMKGEYKFIFGLASDELGYILDAVDYGEALYSYERSMSIGSQIGPMTMEALLELLEK